MVQVKRSAERVRNAGQRGGASDLGAFIPIGRCVPRRNPAPTASLMQTAARFGPESGSLTARIHGEIGSGSIQAGRRLYRGPRLWNRLAYRVLHLPLQSDSNLTHLQRVEPIKDSSPHISQAGAAGTQAEALRRGIGQGGRTCQAPVGKPAVRTVGLSEQ
jgi:hypothetical protein